MKNPSCFKSVLAPVLTASLVVLTSLCSLAQAGGAGNSGGGDPCEARIQFIRDNIFSWIAAGKASELKLPNGVKLTDYSKKMSEVLKVTKDNKGNKHEATFIECVDHPVDISKQEKVCKFENYNQQVKGPKITCDYNTFMDFKTTPVEEQYRLIHHEYAGLAGLELPVGPESQYSISNQISDKLRVEQILMLPVESSTAAQIPPEIRWESVADCKLQNVAIPPNAPADIVDESFQKHFKILFDLSTCMASQAASAGVDEVPHCLAMTAPMDRGPEYEWDLTNASYSGDDLIFDDPDHKGKGVLITNYDGGPEYYYLQANGQINGKRLELAKITKVVEYKNWVGNQLASDNKYEVSATYLCNPEY